MSQITLQSLRRECHANPRDGFAANAMGKAYANLRDWPRAVKWHRKAVALMPSSPFVRLDLAKAFTSNGNVEEATEEFEAALSHSPNDSNLLLAFARHMNDLGNRTFATNLVAKAIRYAPHRLDLYSYLANIQIAHMSLCEARAQVFKEAGAFTTLPAINVGLSQALFDFGRYPECLDECNRALNTTDIDIESLSTLLSLRAESLVALRDIDTATSEYEGILAMQCRLDPVFQGCVRHLFRIGQWERMQNLFRRAIGACEINLGACDGLPQWDGSPAPGKGLLIDRYWGAGDTIQFSRFIRFASERGLDPVIQCSSAIKPLIESVAGVSEVAERYESRQPCHYHCQASFVGVLASDLTTDLADPGPYFRVPQTLVRHWHERIAPLPGLRVGINWSGSGGGVNRDPYWSRDIPFEKLVSAVAIPGVVLFSLQVGAQKSPLEESKNKSQIIDLGKDFRNFSDTAAAMINLDLVITNDTSVAHLAGALRRPTFVVLPYFACWRWGLHHTTPWYSLMRLFRQSEVGQWDGPLQEVNRMLYQMR